MNRKRKYPFKYYFLLVFYSLIIAVMLSIAFVALTFVAVPPGAARYVMQNCRLSEPASVFSSIYGQETSAAERDKPEHRPDTVNDTVSDFGLLVSVELPNIGSGFGGLIIVEAGTPLNMETLSVITGHSIVPLTDLSLIPTDDIGYYRITVQSDSKVRTCLLIITDSADPIVSVGSRTLWVGEDPQPEDFIVSASDGTALNYFFLAEPSCSDVGETTVVIAAEDRAEHLVSAEIRCQVFKDTEPPVIWGVKDKSCIIGDPVLYKDGVTVTDNRDGDDITFSVDISAVKADTPGSYPVVYTATDSTGLTASVTATYSFEFAHEAQVKQQIKELLDPIMSKIIKDGMSEREKARAIYKWVRAHIGYVNYSKKDDKLEGALAGLKKHSGDCFTYASVSKVMFDYVGIENVDIEKEYSPKRPNAHHYWNMVKIDGNWYHFDATPRVDHATFFLVTTDTILDYSRRHKDSHLFSPDKYPKTP